MFLALRFEDANLTWKVKKFYGAIDSVINGGKNIDFSVLVMITIGSKLMDVDCTLSVFKIIKGAMDSIMGQFLKN